MKIIQPYNMIINGNSAEYLNIDDPRKIITKEFGWWTSHLDLITKHFASVSKHIKLIGIYSYDIEIPTINTQITKLSLELLKTDEIGRIFGDYNLNEVNGKITDSIEIINLAGVSSIIYFQIEDDENVYVSIGYNKQYTNTDRYTLSLHYNKKLERDKIKNVENVIVLPEYDNKNRKRFYGKRIGDVVKFEGPDKEIYYGIVSNYSLADNNRLELKTPYETIQLAAEMCEVVFTVEMLGNYNQLFTETKSRINLLHQIISNDDETNR